MISKETFVKVIQLIRTQEETDDKFSEALMLVCDGHPLYGVNNQFQRATMILLKEIFHDLYDYIDWWLYEDVEHTVSDEENEWHLDTASDLYDFLIERQEEWIAAEEKKSE